MSQPVSAEARRRDLIAIGILLLGAVIAAYGYVELHTMATGTIVRVPGQTALQRAQSYNAVMYTGVGIMVVGVVAVIWSFWRARRQG